ncbi:hypothetical protein ACOBR2_10605 [Telmatobacter bradus]|uniref:hypothetical protein n=1 Tax=Telmatobacter bradus TaxID=474953 RepID=UPI003B435D95
MKRWAILLSFLVMLAATVAHAQDSDEDKTGKGTLTGRVFYTDSKTPARLAQVTLLKLVSAGDKTPTSKNPFVAMLSKGGCGLKCFSSTGLDGRFVMDEVPAGSYVVMAVQQGAVPPLARGDLNELNKASLSEVSADVIKSFAKDLTIVSVVAGKKSDVDVNLTHGAVLQGTVSYDDGSPAVAVKVHLLYKTKSGEFAEPNAMSLGAAATNSTLMGYMTDDSGHYRIAGLAPGSYAVRVELPLNMLKNLSKNLMGAIALGVANPKAMGNATAMGDGLSVYSGNVFFKKDLKAIAVGENEQTVAEDLTIPVDGMHSVTAHVVESATGKGVGVAQVLLMDSEGKETLRSGFVDDDGTCTFDYVPNGLYLLRVANAMAEKEKGQGYLDASKIQHYKGSEAKVQVNEDVSGVQLSVSKIESESK